MHGDHWSRRHIVRNVQHFVDPAAILAGGRAAVFGIRPLQHLVAGADAEILPLPIHFAGDARLFRAADEEGQPVVVGLGRHLPPEAHHAGTIDGGLKGRGLAIVDRIAARGVRAVVRDDVLAEPHAVAIGAPAERGCIQRVTERVNSVDGEHGIGAFHPAHDVADHD